MSDIRPLPPRPSLEFERKEAKALLRRLRAGDPDSLARAYERHPAMDASAPERPRLADAQLVIAREYGFTSWPRLVRYFGDVARQQPGIRQLHHRRDWYEQSVDSVLRGHASRTTRAGRLLAAYAPRFFGLRLNDVFNIVPTEDEARLVVARQYAFPNWDLLLETVAAELARRRKGWDIDPFQYAKRAVEAADLDELKRVVDAHPDLLRPTQYDNAKGRDLLVVALHYEREDGGTTLAPIVEWLQAQGVDLQVELNRQLCGHLHMTTEKVQWLLDRGADPNWIAPNGICVLEHALIRYWNGEAVDLLAAHVKPRRALWIAAGLGDVDSVRRCLDGHGRPTPAARRLRPDFDAVGPSPASAHPDPEDEEILMEAFLVALLNGRLNVLEYMATHGTPVNNTFWEMPALHMAVGNAMVPIVECLLRCGADPNLRGRHPAQTAREIARWRFEQDPANVACRRVVELLGMDPDAVLAERDAQPAPSPNIHPKFHEVLELAGDDAFRRQQDQIGPENLLFGLLRSGGLPASFFKESSGRDLERFNAEAKDRLLPIDDRLERPKLALDPGAVEIVEGAVLTARQRRRDLLLAAHLLYAMLKAEPSPAVQLLTRYGASASALIEELERAI
jgi:hypothetical protein